MAVKIHGRLAAADLAATTDTTLYSPPVGRKATVTVKVCNRGASSVNVRVMQINAATIAGLALSDYLEYDTALGPAGSPSAVLERSGVCLAAAQCVGARASATGVSVVVDGIDEDVV